MRRICRYIPLLLLVLGTIHVAQAQSFFDIGLAFGAAQDKASALGIDQTTFLNCSNPAAGTNCVPTPSLSAFMMGFQMNLILWKHVGAGFSASFQPAKQNYAVLQTAVATSGTPQINLQSRFTFYDIDGVYQPWTSKKAALQIKGGLSVANLKFYESVSGSNAIIGNFNQSQYAGSSNHVGAHFGAGVQIFFADHWFLRPEFDGHYIRNLTQFGSNFVKQEMVTVGYSWGDR